MQASYVSWQIPQVHNIQAIHNVYLREYRLWHRSYLIKLLLNFPGQLTPILVSFFY